MYVCMYVCMCVCVCVFVCVCVYLHEGLNSLNSSLRAANTGCVNKDIQDTIQFCRMDSS